MQNQSRYSIGTFARAISAAFVFALLMAAASPVVLAQRYIFATRDAFDEGGRPVFVTHVMTSDHGGRYTITDSLVRIPNLIDVRVFVVDSSIYSLMLTPGPDPSENIYLSRNDVRDGRFNGGAGPIQVPVSHCVGLSDAHFEIDSVGNRWLIFWFSKLRVDLAAMTVVPAR